MIIVMAKIPVDKYSASSFHTRSEMRIENPPISESETQRALDVIVVTDNIRE